MGETNTESRRKVHTVARRTLSTDAQLQCVCVCERWQNCTVLSFEADARSAKLGCQSRPFTRWPWPSKARSSLARPQSQIRTALSSPPDAKRWFTCARARTCRSVQTCVGVRRHTCERVVRVWNQTRRRKKKKRNTDNVQPPWRPGRKTAKRKKRKQGSSHHIPR